MYQLSGRYLEDFAVGQTFPHRAVATEVPLNLYNTQTPLIIMYFYIAQRAVLDRGLFTHEGAGNIWWCLKSYLTRTPVTSPNWAS